MSQRPESERLVRIEKAYAKVPSFQCKQDCSDCCGPIMMSRLEWKRICDTLGYEPKGEPGALDCPMLKDGKCSIYEIRPAICRVFGATTHPILKCPHVAPVSPWSPKEADVFMQTVERLGS